MALRGEESRRPVARTLIASLVVCLVVACEGSPAKGPSSVAPRSSAATSSEAKSFPDPPKTQVAAGVAGDLQTVLEDAVKDKTSIGVTAAVVSPAGIWAGAAGVGGDGESLDSQAQLAIGNITQNFVAAQVMRLVEDGKVDLDAKLSAYIPLPVPDRGATVRDAFGPSQRYPGLLDR